jgi:hypothetical protein
MLYVGIDPGASGGLAALSPDGKIVSFKSIKDEKTIWEWINHFRSLGQGVAVIEKVSGYIGGEGQPGSAMFNFGQSYGFLRGCLVASGHTENETFHVVPPQEWQRALSIPKRVRLESRTAWKGRLKKEAERRFPSLKVTLATADALLIALYCLQTYGRKDA